MVFIVFIRSEAHAHEYCHTLHGIEKRLRIFQCHGGVCLKPVVTFYISFPVFSGTHHVVRIIRVKRVVAPVVDLAAEICEFRISYTRVVNSVIDLHELLYPVAGERRKSVGWRDYGVCLRFGR